MQVLNRTKLVAAAALVMLSSGVPAQNVGIMVTPSDLKWKPNPRNPSLEVAEIINGDGTKPGPYVFRVKFPANNVTQAHSHPDERTYTVISGTWYVGFGPKLDESKLKALPAGSFHTEPANVPHFVVTKGEPVLVQITGTGPTGQRFVDPAHAPRKQ